MPSARPEMGVERLRELFEELDAELDGRDEPVRVLVAGGAALAFRWNERTTYDVDLVGGEFPSDLRRAVAVVAERHNLESDWLNAGAVVGNAALEPRPRPLYVGRNFKAYSPDARYLLAMKLFANRDRDLDDAVRLSEEAGITVAAEMIQLIDDAYFHNVIPEEILEFADEVALTVAERATQRRSDPVGAPDRGRGTAESESEAAEESPPGSRSSDPRQ